LFFIWETIVIAAGFIIILGFIFIFVKLPMSKRLWLLGHPLALDITVSVLAYIVHWGTFTGVMAAAFAGMMCSALTWVGRKTMGYIENGKYTPGIFTVKGD